MISKNPTRILGPACLSNYLLTLAYCCSLSSCKDLTRKSRDLIEGKSDKIISQNGEDSGGDEVVEAKVSGTPRFYAADPEFIGKNSKLYFKVWNDTFSKKFDELPTAGEVTPERKPYSGGYYPEREGGTNTVMVGGRSPLQKYDDVFHSGQSKAVQWENEKHTNGPVWSGHCNGFAAAAIRHPKEPFKQVQRGNVTFAPQDIKALLAEIYMNADYEFIGGNRCNQDKPPTFERVLDPDRSPDPTVMDACEDVNPGTMHLVLTHWIGKMRHPIVIDTSLNDEVWNYPAFGFRVVKKEEIPESLARQYVSNSGGDYVFNPKAEKFVYLNTKIFYADALKREVLGQLVTKEMDLHYVLELDSQGEIMGGEWAGAQSRKYHPDFMWVPFEPATPNGTRYMGNPFIDANEVFKLWAESAGFEPSQAPKGLTRPRDVVAWGRFSLFDVWLDGKQSGSVFMGRQTALQVKPKAGLFGASVSLAIELNGVALKSFAPMEKDGVWLQFDPRPGLGLLRFTWKRENTIVEDQYLRFFVAP